MLFVVIQALPSRHSEARLRQLDLPFGLSCACNALWLIFWHHRQLELSMLLMLGLLGSLMLAYTRLEKHRSRRTFVDVTFSVYLGWVGLATILNMAIWLNSLGWTGAPLPPQAWAGIMLGVACALYLYLGLRNEISPLFRYWSVWALRSSSGRALYGTGLQCVRFAQQA